MRSGFAGIRKVVRVISWNTLCERLGGAREADIALWRYAMDGALISGFTREECDDIYQNCFTPHRAIIGAIREWRSGLLA